MSNVWAYQAIEHWTARQRMSIVSELCGSMMSFELRTMRNTFNNAAGTLTHYQTTRFPACQAIDLKWLRKWHGQFCQAQANAIGWASR